MRCTCVYVRARERIKKQGNIASSEEGSGSESDHAEEDLELVYHADGSVLGPTSGFEISIQEKISEQEAAISRLTEENLTLKERMYILEKEMARIRRSVDIDSDHSEGTSDQVDPNTVTTARPSEASSDHSAEKAQEEYAREEE